MTQQVPPPLSTRPNPSRAPGAVIEPGPSRRARLQVTAPLCLLGFLAVYLVAVCTPFGQRAENALLSGDDAKQAWIYDWSGTAYQSSAMPPLNHTALPTVLAGLAVIAAVTLVRRCWWQGCAATAIVVVALGGKELIWMILPRPDLVDAPVWLIERSFPSGHAAVPAVLALGAALVASPRIRPYAIVAGMVWLAVTAAAVQATYHHRPSDVLGSALLACACYSLATRLLPPADAPDLTRPPRPLPAVVLTLPAAGALVAGARTDSVTQSLVFAAAAFLCAALFWFTTAQGHRVHSTPHTPRTGLTTRLASGGNR
ncbi:phosphatase PAP2 family protein [Streptomyces albipurpureus]|uniref:Phosphatase PAP2 family protein n=1 Tax=Streptomyces albipurpureus TaxID=2897419 RepID=A0ABT0UF31_9ACTN|nr:phosphatase PAP2 family protein [Streptomyces sp. CWNU-1]MCM2387207.1 phosphatase PAP2 family protein [Streptomyces sp. CWNU-1]